MRKNLPIILCLAGLFLFTFLCVLKILSFDPMLHQNNTAEQNQARSLGPENSSQNQEDREQSFSKESGIKETVHLGKGKEADKQDVSQKLSRVIIKGRVVDSEGYPAPDAIVQIYTGNTPPECNHKSHTVQIRVYHDGIKNDEGELRTKVDWKRCPQYLYDKEHFIAGVKTDSEGNFVIELKDLALKNPYYIMGKRIELKEGEIDVGILRLSYKETTTIIHGEVFDVWGNSIKDYKIIFSDFPQWTDYGEKPETTQEGNKFYIRIYVTGTYRFYIIAEGHAPKGCALELTRDDRGHTLRVELNYGVELYGVVKSVQGSLLPKAKVALTSTVHKLEYETNESGSFSFKHISPDLDYTLTIEHPDYEPLTKEFKGSYFATNTYSLHEFALKAKEQK